jgi:hypothetical protein
LILAVLLVWWLLVCYICKEVFDVTLGVALRGDVCAVASSVCCSECYMGLRVHV